MRISVMFNFKMITYQQTVRETLFPGGKILIIDDDLVIRSSFQEIITLHQGVAVTAANGIEALEVLQKETFDLVLVDLFMPQMSGEEFIKIFRQQDSVTPLIVMSGQAKSKNLVQSIRKGIDDFLIKPFNQELFLYRLNDVYQKKVLAKTQIQLLQEKIYPEFFQSSPLPMVISNLNDGTYYAANPKTSELLGYSQEELLNKEAHNSKLWASRKDFDTFRQVLLDKGYISGYETTFLTKSGKKIPALIYAKTINIQDVPYIIASLVDNSDNKALDNILRFQANSLTFLKESGDELLNIKNIASEEIYQIIISRLNEILGDSCLGLVFGEVDKTEQSIFIKYSHFAEKEIETISQKTLKTNFLTHSYQVRPEEKAALLTNKLIPLGNNIYVAMFRAFPKEKVALLEKTIGKNAQIYVIGFANNNMLLGGVTVLIKQNAVFFQQELLEAYVKQAAIALKQRRLYLEKEAQKQQLSLVFQKSNIGMMVLSKKNYIEQVNEKICKMLGYTREELLAINPEAMSPELPIDQKESRTHLKEMLHSVHPGQPVIFDWKIRRKDGREVDAEISLNSILVDSEEVIYGTVRDVSVYKNEEFLKYHDKITRLPNFSFLKKTLATLIKEKTNFTIITVKLEHKKIKTLTQYREKEFIDENYIQLTEALQKKFFEEDVICRNSELEPEEFAILFKKTTEPTIINKLLRKLDEVFPSFGQNEIFADTCVLKYPADFQDKPLATAEDVFKRIAGLTTLTTTKKEAASYNKNRHLFFNKTLEDNYLEKIFLEKYLRENCYKKNYDKAFDVYYQPKMDKEFKVVALEALLRVKHPKLGIINPIKFIDILEESGLIIGAERWLLQKTFAQLKKWQQEFPNLGCSINIHPLNLTTDYVNFFTNALLVSGLNPQTVELEIIERAVLNKESVVVLTELRKLGIEISVDDFQTGTANITNSLKNLKDIVTKIKFDRSMVDTAAEPLAILKHLMALCHELGKKVIAEGIETMLAAEKLKEIGCNYFQGYVFSRPLSVKQLKAYLVEQRNKEKNAS